MVNHVVLDDRLINVYTFEDEIQNGLINISFHFKVTHEEYHEITTLLYKGTFDVQVPEKQMSFEGIIKNYATSITNLYEEGAVGDYFLSLIEVSK